MDNRQLQIFQQVATWRSFTKAAKALHMAQPAVSIAVRKLEEELDVVLLNRADKKVELTHEGQVLLAHAERILKQFQQARLEMAELRDLETGEVRLGTSAMLGAYYFPQKIAEFRQHYPNIRLQVIGVGTRRAQQLILDGSIDMGIVNMNARTAASVVPELEVRPLINEEVVACVTADHRFAKLPCVDFAQLGEEKLIVYREGYYLRDIVSSLSQRFGIKPTIVVETNLLQLMMNLVLQHQGVSVCLRRVVEREKALVGVPFREPVHLELGIAWKCNHYLSRANRVFVEFLLEGMGR